MWEQDIGVFPVSFRQQGDEWAHHLRARLPDGEHMRALGTDGTGPVEFGPPLFGPVHSRLLASPDPGGIRCVVIGEDDAAEPDQVDLWRRAGQEAVSLLGAGDQVFVWEAMIGTSPRTAGLCRLGPLEEPLNVGPIRLTSGGMCMRELVISERRAGFRHGTGAFRHSFPVIASGQVRTYAWDHAALTAELCLRRTCALLSLVTGQVWIPRTHPYEFIEKEGPLRVPAVFGYVPQIPDPAGETEWTGDVPADVQPFRLPDWVVQAWATLDEDAGLTQALYALYEGMRLELEHPSIALLTFVAATEGFGKRFVPDAPCDCIPGCKHEKGVAQKRFRKALKTIMTNREVEQIARIAYGYRSSTGHEGVLFGSEDTFGYSHHLSFFDVPVHTVFDYAILGRIRNASREILARALGRPNKLSLTTRRLPSPSEFVAVGIINVTRAVG